MTPPISALSGEPGGEGTERQVVERRNHEPLSGQLGGRGVFVGDDLSAERGVPLPP